MRGTQRITIGQYFFNYPCPRATMDTTATLATIVNNNKTLYNNHNDLENTRDILYRKLHWACIMKVRPGAYPEIMKGGWRVVCRCRIFIKFCRFCPFFTSFSLFPFSSPFVSNSVSPPRR